jgi:hypothetical protein
MDERAQFVIGYRISVLEFIVEGFEGNKPKRTL